ncbi:MAG: HD domain-containing protein [Promethearchaeota archaeon]
MKRGLESKIRTLVERESRSQAMDEWSEFFRTMDLPLFNYRFDHVLQVVRIAKYLAEETSANVDVVVMAAWFHDIDRPGIDNPPTPLPHGVGGAERAREFLLGEGVDSATVERVCDAIRKHPGYTLKAPLEPLEAQIVWEADKLTKVGLVQTVRSIILSTRYEPNPTMEGILEQVRKALPQLREIVASMHTEPAKRLAKAWIQNIEFFINKLEGELNL